jgi:hypothetical protein
LPLNIEQNQTLKSDYETFRRYLKNNFNFGFKTPRSDLCDWHFKYEQEGLNNLSNDEKEIFQNHVKKVENYRELKKITFKK